GSEGAVRVPGARGTFEDSHLPGGADAGEGVVRGLGGPGGMAGAGVVDGPLHGRRPGLRAPGMAGRLEKSLILEERIANGADDLPFGGKEDQALCRDLVAVHPDRKLARDAAAEVDVDAELAPKRV